MKSVLLFLALCSSAFAQDFYVDTPVSTSQVTATHVTAQTVSATGNVSANKFIGDGSLLTGISGGSTSPSWYAIQGVPAQVQRVSDSGYLAASGLGVAGTVTATTVSASTVTTTVINANIASLTALTVGSCTGCGGGSPTSIDANIISGVVKNDVSASNVTATSLYPAAISQTVLSANATKLTSLYVVSRTLIGASSQFADTYGPAALQVVGADGTNMARFLDTDGSTGFGIYTDKTLTHNQIYLGAVGNQSWCFTTNGGVGLLDLQNNGGISIGSYACDNGTPITPPTNGLVVSGNVGIGVSNPSTPLQVNGTISATNVTIAANVGTCNTANRGMLRYSTSSNTLQFCNGTGWKSLSPTTL